MASWVVIKTYLLSIFESLSDKNDHHNSDQDDKKVFTLPHVVCLTVWECMFRCNSVPSWNGVPWWKTKTYSNNHLKQKDLQYNSIIRNKRNVFFYSQRTVMPRTHKAAYHVARSNSSTDIYLYVQQKWVNYRT